MRPGWPPGYDLSVALKTYMFLLGAFSFSTEPKEAQESQRQNFRNSPEDPYATGALSSFADWQQQHFRQLAFRAMWQSHFEQIDVFLMPVSFTVAFHHDHGGDMTSRILKTPEGERPYIQLMPWMVTATLTGCPATVAPAGENASGLPVGIQIMGPFGEDATPIEFASLLSDEIGGFKAPPGFKV